MAGRATPPLSGHCSLPDRHGPAYCRSLSAFQQVVTQRNSLLRSLREQGVNPHSPAVEAQLAFWDERLVQHGAAVVVRRHQFVLHLEQTAYLRHAE